MTWFRTDQAVDQALNACFFLRLVFDPPSVDGTNSGGFRRVFTLSDHLGNTRISFSDFDDDGYITTIDDPLTPENYIEITQELHYYPFGMQQDGEWFQTVAPDNKFRYNGFKL